MSKQILPTELLEIVGALLVAPEKTGQLDTLKQYQSFVQAIGEAVADYCGGTINCVSDPETTENFLSDVHSSPFISVSPDDSLPSIHRNVWSAYDPEGWEDEVEESEDDSEPVTEQELDEHRASYREAVIKAMNIPMSGDLSMLEGGFYGAHSAPTKASQYVQSGGCKCPSCGSDDITGDSVEIDAGCAKQSVYCSECGAEWTDVYSLSSISDVSGFDPNEPSIHS
jgi:hypothetical protein